MIRNNPQFGLWDEPDGETPNRYPKPHAILDVKRENEWKIKQYNNSCYTYYADVELLKQGIIKKIGEKEDEKTESGSDSGSL